MEFWVHIKRSHIILRVYKRTFLFLPHTLLYMSKTDGMLMDLMAYGSQAYSSILLALTRENTCASGIVEHWLYANIYTPSLLVPMHISIVQEKTFISNYKHLLGSVTV